MKELGAYLKRTRISNGVNITEAAEDLDLSVPELENIESGNVKAFKDVYDLKNYVKSYAKYLGLDSEKVVDEFNVFLFDHTSKISLQDIEMAQKKEKIKEDTGVNKISSPYTKEFKKKSYAVPIFLVTVVLLILIFVIIFIVVNVTHTVPDRVNELRGGKEIYYEFTY